MINPLQPVLQKNDRQARWLIILVSAIVFGGIAFLSRVKINVDPGFDVHLFAKFNAIINSTVAVFWWRG